MAGGLTERPETVMPHQDASGFSTAGAIMTGPSNSPMNILHVVRALDEGGVTTYGYRLTEGLVERGRRVTILAREGSWREAPRARGVGPLSMARQPGSCELGRGAKLRPCQRAQLRPLVLTTRFGSLLCRQLRLPLHYDSTCAAPGITPAGLPCREKAGARRERSRQE